MNEMLKKAELLKNTLISEATGDKLETGDYEKLRRIFIMNSKTNKLLPEYIKIYRNLTDFWQFIKKEFAHYSERRLFITQSLSDLFLYLEKNVDLPSDSIITASIEKYGKEYIKESWDKSLSRREIDPEGAITAARTLIETVCKYILDSSKVLYSQKADLPTLYKLTSKELNLAPENHNEMIFKQILSGCISVINGLGTLRNQISDAHGKGIKYVKPSSRHASLVVNLSGSMAMFLIETFDNKNNKSK
jgi:uncharacterized protein YfkK (UPF0435 family)